MIDSISHRFINKSSVCCYSIIIEPPSLFQKRLLSVDEITISLRKAVQACKNFNPQLKVNARVVINDICVWYVTLVLVFIRFSDCANSESGPTHTGRTHRERSKQGASALRRPCTGR